MSWVDRLLPASFRGAAFLVEEHSYRSGRRVAEFEFPYRDEGSTEDLGKRLSHFEIDAFLLGDDYDLARNALAKACNDSSDIGTLVHPFLGRVRVRCAEFELRERREPGGIASIRLSFIKADYPPSPTASQDTASGVLAGIASWLPIARAAFAYGSLIARDPAVLIGFAGDLLNSAAGSLLLSLTGLPASTFASLVPTIEGMAANLFNADSGVTADAVASAFQAAAAAIVALPVPDPIDDPVAGITPIAAAPPDPSYGLSALADWGPPPMAAALLTMLPVQQLQATTQQQITDLVRDNAVIAVLTVYAQTDWPSSNAAAAAQAQVITWLDERTDAAALAGNAALTLAWQGIGALAVADLTARIQSLPTIGPYLTRASLSSLSLAQYLFQDPTQADALAQLNDAIHPAFMPTAGVALAAAA